MKVGGGLIKQDNVREFLFWGIPKTFKSGQVVLKAKTSKNCQNGPGAAGDAVGVAAASAVCTYYVIIGGALRAPI